MIQSPIPIIIGVIPNSIKFGYENVENIMNLDN